MRTRVSTFRYPIGLSDARGENIETIAPWVDRGALYSQFPASMLEWLGYRPNAMRTFKLADGRIIESPIGPVQMVIGDETQPVLCIFGEEEGESLLGATALETFSLAADPVNETLVQTIAMRLSKL